jgi:hypothetical protein
MLRSGRAGRWSADPARQLVVVRRLADRHGSRRRTAARGRGRAAPRRS